ncbi:hypothetical protein LFX25_06890 [Leptospira sp. FAT2]|nr:hypothetical protein [Leptospira sanjuanensis]MCG6167546.1 hypothetical protein [Leptospira sanjuanensis]MCG6192965.1 hypothetical protein [Leptospira sanjuanensis]
MRTNKHNNLTEAESPGRVAATPVITETLPDGTKLHNNYSTNGTLSNITMDSADGTSVGHTVVSYQGPYLNANGVPSVRRVSGNGVTMEIGFEPVEKLPVSILSTKPDGSVIANAELTYDAKNNVTKIDCQSNTITTQQIHSSQFDFIRPS